MESRDADIGRWSAWCLENTCSLLQRKFPGSAVWIVRPSRMLRHVFSCYHNFVTSSITGVPSYSAHHGAVLHTQALLQDAVHQARERGELELSVHEAVTKPVVIAGFSKGCVVLNQILHEFVNYHVDATKPELSAKTPSLQTAKTTSSCGKSKARPTTDQQQYTLPPSPEDLKRLREFVLKVRALYWLDSGHSGTSGAWVTKEECLKVLASLKIRVCVAVTPHQVCDPHREWIREEKEEFVATLRQLGASVEDTLYFENEEKSLEWHFRLLDCFDPLTAGEENKS